MFGKKTFKNIIGNKNSKILQNITKILKYCKKYNVLILNYYSWNNTNIIYVI